MLAGTTEDEEGVAAGLAGTWATEDEATAVALGFGGGGIGPAFEVALATSAARPPAFAPEGLESMAAAIRGWRTKEVSTVFPADVVASCVLILFRSSSQACALP